MQLLFVTVLVGALLQAVGEGASPAAPDSTRWLDVDAGAQHPAVSPDGRQIAVSLLGRIHVLPVEGGAARQVSHGAGWDHNPAWSPDGQVLVWARSLPTGSAIVAQDLARSTPQTLHNVTTALGGIAFHPVTQEIHFVQERKPSEAYLWRRPSWGGRGERITEGLTPDERSFAFSPEGDEILVESARYGATDLYLISPSDGSRQRITESSAREHQVAWGRDRWVYLSREDGVDHLVVRPVRDGEARVVYSSPADGKTFALTPDGSSAIMASGGRLLRIDLDTGGTEPIPFTARVQLPERESGDLVVAGARVFTGRGDAYLEDATVVVRGGRIERVETGPPGPLPDGVRVLEADGRVLMAGLVDNHWHYGTSPFLSGPLLLERGITSARDPGADLASSLAFREALRSGLLPGPALYTVGPLIDGAGGYRPEWSVELSTPEGAEALVGSLAALGVDAIKVYFMLEPDVLEAVVRAARAHGLPVTGHIGVRASWAEAVDAGVAGLNHIRVWRDLLPPDAQPDGWDGSLDEDGAPLERMQADWSGIDPDGPEAWSLLRRMAEAGVALDPTLNIQRPTGLRRSFTDAQRATMAEAYAAMERFLLNAWQAGVKILAGTDNGSIFDELEAYAQAGIPNAEILRAATLNGAEWLGRGDEFGTVEVGKRADLILVDGDPLADIQTLRRIRVVIQEGRVVVLR